MPGFSYEKVIAQWLMDIFHIEKPGNGRTEGLAAGGGADRSALQAARHTDQLCCATSPLEWEGMSEPDTAKMVGVYKIS